MKRIWMIVAAAILLAAAAADGGATDRRTTDGAPPARKPNGDPIKTYMNINNISTVYWTNGFTDIDVQDNNAGFEFPKGSNRTAIFKSGFLWGGLVDGEARVGGSSFKSGLQGGKIISPGIAEDPDLPKNRIYRVRRDIPPAYDTDTPPSVASEVSDGEGSEEQILSQYVRDWNEWPALDGAPFEDKNANGIYEPATDIPGFPGADQTIWYVANDLNSANTTDLYGSNPIGIELQVTAWAYALQGALGNMNFRRYLMINKSAAVVESTYVTQWADPDLGFSDDDYVGCDTTLSLGYVYNAAATDQTYSPLPPPSAGFDFFQGPIVPSPGSTAIARGQVIHDAMNLPMTAFYYFAKGDLTVTDPTQGTYEGTEQFYNFMRGRVGKTGAPFVDPNTNQSTTFCMAGDPQTRRGWVDGQVLNPDDRRMGLASGPFTLAPGDTQEIVVAVMAAGAIEGVDRLSAIGLLKFYDQQAQIAYNNFFDLPVPPPAPRVTISELDREVVLNWGEDAAGARRIETWDSKGYKFQGYNVYQLPSASATIDQAKRIATYDIVDGVGKIRDLYFDPVTGEVLQTVKQFGNDTGLRRYVSVKNNELEGGLELVNGIRYYFAVTAYSFNADPTAVPNNLETPLAILTTTPKAPDPGYRPMASLDTLGTVTHITNVPGSSLSDGYVVPQVINPDLLEGASYRIVFQEVDGAQVWHLIRTLNGAVDTVARNVQDQNGTDAGSPIVDGVIFRVYGAPDDFKEFLTVANAAGPLSPPEAGAFGFNSSGFPYPNTEDSPNGTRQQTAGLGESQGWGIHTGEAPDQSRTDYTQFIDRVTQSGARWPLIIPNDFEIRFTARGGKALIPEDFSGYPNLVIDVPFELWNTGIGTPDDPSDDYRLFPYILDLDEDTTFDLLDQPTLQALGFGDTADHSISGGTNDPYTDWFYWVIPEDVTPGESGYSALLARIEAEGAAYEYLAGAQGDVMRRMVLVLWNGGDVNTPTSYSAQMPETGTIFRITTTKPNRPTDEFVISTPVYSMDTELAKADVGSVNVFPNPYYAVNSEELNKYQRFVTFSHLPVRATIRIFNLAGVMVRRIDKESSSQFERWDLANGSGLPVGSGLYIAHIEMPDQGATKILKLAIVQEQQILDRY